MRGEEGKAGGGEGEMQNQNDNKGKEKKKKPSLTVAGVCLHVAVQIARLGKSEVAHLTPVRFLSTVDALVLGEGGGIRKALPAVVTAVGALPRVGTEVGRHRRALRETLLADGAAERLFPAVRSEVGGEIGRLGEGLAASFATIGFLSTVGPHVCLEGRWSGVALTAYLTDVAPGLAQFPRPPTHRAVIAHVTGYGGRFG